MQAAKFLLVGIGNTCLSFAVFTLLVHALPPGPLMAGISQAVSYLCGMAASFLMNNFWVFRSRRQPSTGNTLPRFITAQVTFMMLSSVTIATASKALPIRPELIWVVVMGMITVLNFLVLKKWVFKTQ